MFSADSDTPTIINVYANQIESDLGSESTSIHDHENDTGAVLNEETLPEELVEDVDMRFQADIPGNDENLQPILIY